MNAIMAVGRNPLRSQLHVWCYRMKDVEDNDEVVRGPE